MKITVLSSITIAVSLLVFLEQDVYCAESGSQKRGRSDVGDFDLAVREENRKLRTRNQRLYDDLQEANTAIRNLIRIKQSLVNNQKDLLRHNAVLGEKNRELANANKGLTLEYIRLWTQYAARSGALSSSLVPSAQEVQPDPSVDF